MFGLGWKQNRLFQISLRCLSEHTNNCFGQGPDLFIYSFICYIAYLVCDENRHIRSIKPGLFAFTDNKLDDSDISLSKALTFCQRHEYKWKNTFINAT